MMEELTGDSASSAAAIDPHNAGAKLRRRICRTDNGRERADVYLEGKRIITGFIPAIHPDVRSKLREEHRFHVTTVVSNLLVMQRRQIHDRAVFDKHVKKALVTLSPINHGA